MTTDTLKAYTNYWKCSLADGELGRGTFTKAQAKALNARSVSVAQIQRERLFEALDSDWLAGQAGDGAESQMVTAADVKRWATETNTDTDWVKCVVYPYVYFLQTRHQHGWKSRRYAPEVIAPCSFTVLVNAKGRMLAYGRPTIARELLDPAYAGQALVLGAIDDMDGFFNDNPFPDYLDEEDPVDEDRWTMQKVMEYADELLDTVVQKSLTRPLDDEDAEYVLVHEGLVHPTDVIEGAIRPLVDVFDAVKIMEPEAPLAEKLVSGAPGKPEKIGINASILSRYGAMEGAFALGLDQRLALAAANQLKSGDVLAVNGPPGTGKTTLLKDLVASRYVLAALEGRDPDILVISSTNNQAVTNVLDTFNKGHSTGEEVLEKRWLDGWDSFGVFLASKARRASAQAQGYQTDEDIKAFEDSAVINEQEDHFLQAMERFVGEPPKSLDIAISELHKRLRQEWRTLRACLELPRVYQDAVRSGVPQDCQNQLRKISRTLGALKHDSTEVREQLQVVSGWLQEVSRLQGQRKQALTREQKILDALSQFEASLTKFWQTVQFWPVFRGVVDRRRAEALATEGIPNADLPLDVIRKQAQEQQRRTKLQFGKAIQQVADESAWKSWAAELDDALDMVWRPRLFWLAVHYFEAVWIKEIKETVRNGDPDRRSQVKVERRWRRWAKLAPAMISTLHSLPRHMNYWDHGRQEELPAFNMIDWLILDEAGQVAPEVSGAAFLLSKRLVAVGDKYQIEPVWNITRQVDMGNLISNRLLKKSHDLETAMESMDATGRLASSGSAIVLAQQVTPRYDQSGMPGVTLVNHRRCLPEIIGYCNELCYEGALIPRRTPASDPGNPHPLQFGLIHVPGHGERAGGSRINILEGACVSGWIAENADDLESRYPNLPLADIVAVVTPFRAQARVITTRLKQYLGERADKVVVGTVHSLQGAERPVVLFSPTYSSHQPQTLFFDRGPNMLNVAVSRAKDQFIVIGDIDVIQGGQHPSRLLFERMIQAGGPMAFPTNGDPLANAAVHTWGDGPSNRLVGREAHDQWLDEVLGRPTINRLTIVTPLLSINSLRQYGERLAQAAMRGAQVDLVISRPLNTGGNRHALFRSAIESLGKNRVIVRQADQVVGSAAFVDNEAWVFGSGSILGAPGDEETPDQRLWSGPLASVLLRHDYIRKEHQRYMIGLGLEAPLR